MRELDECLGLGGLIERHLADFRGGKNTRFPMADLVRQSVFSRLAGYEDVNDAAALWSQAGQDCGTIISSGISGSQTGTDFADEGDRGRKSVGGIGRRNGRFRLWHFQGWQNWPLPWALEAPNAESPAGHCIEKPLGVCYRSSAKS